MIGKRLSKVLSTSPLKEKSPPLFKKEGSDA
jgi:hypothetical protein